VSENVEQSNPRTFVSETPTITIDGPPAEHITLVEENVERRAGRPFLHLLECMESVPVDRAREARDSLDRQEGNFMPAEKLV
jgi:hypothetical protein